MCNTNVFRKGEFAEKQALPFFLVFLADLGYFRSLVFDLAVRQRLAEVCHVVFA